MRDIYVHVDAAGCYQGNGGQLMLTLLAQALVSMGYNVALFDAQDALNPAAFDWMAINDIPPFAPVADALAGERVVSSWLNKLFGSMWAHDGSQSFEWARAHLRYWCQDEMLRQDRQYLTARVFILSGLVPMVISNRSNTEYYRALGFDNLDALDIWIRDEFKPAPEKRITGRVGIQVTPAEEQGWRERLTSAGWADVLNCTGSQVEVRDAMQSCEWFLSWQAPKPMVFDGEGFGLALHEALACGCKAVARNTPNLAHLRGTVALVDRLSGALVLLGDDVAVGDGAAFIDAHYRLDAERRATIERWLA
jgi:hypothetical protein